MDKIKKLFTNKKALYIMGAVVVVFLAWYFWETSKRNKSRQNYVNYLLSLADTDPERARITAKAQTRGVTLEEQAMAEALYLTPSSPFKAKL